MSQATQASGGVDVWVEVNGVERAAAVEPRLLLVHFLREVLGLTATEIGCDSGHCGSCTVLLDGTPVRSCTTFAVQASGRRIMTAEGLSADDSLSPIQQVFWDEHGVDCGFCTPGMILSAYALLQTNPAPTDAEIRRAISGNLCRCMNYAHIVRAIAAAAVKLREEGESSEEGEP
ncbi:MAG: (2Fe-2S)-binding domain protein [Chloroflexi bacterium]|nr:(2Fe-2S)-binding domain protein [Chloroflexota bacterium]